MIREMLEDLLSLSEGVWDSYAFRSEPLARKISSSQRAEFAAGARKCGSELADRVIEKYGLRKPGEYARNLRLQIVYDREKSMGQYAMFACFNEPDRITIYESIAAASYELIMREGLGTLLGDINIIDVLISHELYHYFEFRDDSIYTSRKLITLWSIGRFHYTSKVLCLQEIGAMSFTRRLTGLGFSPYALDVLFMYSMDKHKAGNLYENIMSLAQNEGGIDSI
jgi:hypothetical protein